MKVEHLGYTIEITQHNFWLKLDNEMSTPLSTHYDQNDEMAYCYLVTPDGEARIYEDGSTFDPR